MIFPLGPYHPALTEPVSLRLALRGETVTGVEMHTGYLQRGVETLATQRDIFGALDLVERTCGTCGHSHRLAVCLALESAAGITPPDRARALRTVFSEVERALARLWLLMQIGRLTELGSLLTAAVEAREALFEACAMATETRVFWGVSVPGGVVNVVDPAALAEPLAVISTHLTSIDRYLAENGALARRTAKLAPIDESTAADLGLTGLLLRATGAEGDVRREAPYDAYDLAEEAQLSNAALSETLKGDVVSRLRLAVSDLRLSLQLIATQLDELPEGQERATFPDALPIGDTSATVEAPHGREIVSLRLAGNLAGGRNADLTSPGWLSSISLQTPSMANSGAAPIALVGQHLRDVPLVLASLDLCIACIDR